MHACSAGQSTLLNVSSDQLAFLQIVLHRESAWASSSKVACHREVRVYPQDRSTNDEGGDTSLTKNLGKEKLVRQ